MSDYKTHADAGFLIGATHAICEDYAVAHNDSIVALADGCSGSEFTDIGARLMAVSAIGTANAGCPIEGNAFPELVLDRAKKTVEELRLPIFALDATLLLATAQPRDIKIRIWGDGVLAARSRRTGDLHFWSFEFPSWFPAYLSASLAADPLKAFRERSKMEAWRRIVHWEWRDGSGSYETAAVSDREDILHGLSYTLSYAEWDLVALLSDGAGSFLRQSRTEASITNTPIPLAEILPRLVGFKSTAPGFVQRRLARLRAEWAREGILHTDDISVAAIVVERSDEG